MDSMVDPVDPDRQEWAGIFETLDSQRRDMMLKFTGPELEDRMLKPPIRKITKWELVVEFDFSKYNIEENFKVEDTNLQQKVIDDEVYEP